MSMTELRVTVSVGTSKRKDLQLMQGIDELIEVLKADRYEATRAIQWALDANLARSAAATTLS